jgi:hypothetical protein
VVPGQLNVAEHRFINVLVEQACSQERPVVDLPEELLLAGVVLHGVLARRVRFSSGLALGGGI